MTLKKGINFKEIDKDFKNCGKIPEISAPTDNTKEQKRKSNSSKTTKKLKVDSKRPAQNEQGTSTTENDDSDDELENLKSSYLLTMSQSICKDNEDDVENSEYVFETINEVYYKKVYKRKLKCHFCIFFFCSKY